MFAQKPAGLPGNYPSKPVKVIIGVAPGGGTDALTRLVFEGVRAGWDHPFIFENRTSALGSAMALEYVSRAAADGYTLTSTAGSAYIGAAIVHKTPKNLLAVLDAIAQFNSQVFLLVSSTTLPAANVSELVAHAMKNPGQLNYASAGIGSSAHLIGEYLKLMFGHLDIQHIPYKGMGVAYADLFKGRVQLAFATTASALPHGKRGALRILGITSAKRLDNLPDIPAISESLAGFEYVSFLGAVGPAGIPAPITTALNRQINEVLRQAEVKKALEAGGGLVTPNTPQFFQKTLEDFVQRNINLVRDAKLDLSGASE